MAIQYHELQHLLQTFTESIKMKQIAIDHVLSTTTTECSPVTVPTKSLLIPTQLFHLYKFKNIKHIVQEYQTNT